MLDRQDKQRADAVQEREDKVKNIMNKMGEVYKKSDKHEREQDKRILD